MLLSDFRSAVSAKLGLNNNVLFDQPSIDNWVNQGCLDVCVRARPTVAVSTMTLTAGQYDYTLSTSILAVNEMFITDSTTSVRYKMVHLSPGELNDYRVGTQFLGAPPVRFYAIQGQNMLMVYPTPAAADVITIYYVARPATLAAPTDSPTEIPVEWHKTVEYYACWQGGQFINDAASQNGALYLQLYEVELHKLKMAMLRMGGRRLSKAVVGNRPGDRRPIGRPDQQEV